MFENRAFDHILGYLKKYNPAIDGLDGNEFNYYDPSNPANGKVQVSFDQEWSFGLNPGHSLTQTKVELWGDETFKNPAPMSGFVKEMYHSTNNKEEASRVMKCFNHTTLPTIQTLGMEFSIFDHFFSSVPGPTGPNRMFALSGTSYGAISNEIFPEVKGYPQRTIFDDIYDSGHDFKIYYSDFPVSLELEKLREYPLHIQLIDNFYKDAKDGNLPAFSFLEPRWFRFLEWPEQSEHPYVPSAFETGDIAYGEFLLADIYKALRASPQWNETLFIVSYDEHGGLYDHVSPPQEGVPNPDGRNSTNPPFAFDRLGIRVPFIAASPWINKNTVYHKSKEGRPLDHTSVMHTVRKLFNITLPPLTKREAWSGTFEDIFEERKTPRTDCPAALPIPDVLKHAYYQHLKTEQTPEHLIDVDGWLQQHPEYDLRTEISDLQTEIVQVAAGLSNPPADFSAVKTVHQGALFVRSQIKNFLQNKK